MNILLLAVIAFTILKVVDGYKKGMVKEIISLWIFIDITCHISIYYFTCIFVYTLKFYYRWFWV